MGRILLLLWVAVAVAFAPLGSFAHAPAHTEAAAHHHRHSHADHAHHHHEGVKTKAQSKTCVDCEAPAKSAVPDCCQLGCQMWLAQASPDAIAFPSASCQPLAPLAQHHAGTEPAQSDPPPKA